MNRTRIEKIDNEASNTLMARDYKGFGNQAMNRVIKPECINLYDENGKETSFSDRIYRTDKISAAITASFRPFYLVEDIVRKNMNYRIRKLTPRECWRLMGFSDKDFDKAAEVNSNTQLYKQAGNSIAKDVLMAIFWNLGF